jgi:hypothetical protein
MSGYDNMLPVDTNNDKDVYLVSLDGQEPPVDDEPPVDEEPPVGDDGQPVDDQAPSADDGTTSNDDSGISCSYNPDGRFDPVLPALLLFALAYLCLQLIKKRAN